MLNVPILATASQILSVSLAGQSCRIDIYQKTPGLFLDLYVNDILIVAGVLGRNSTLMVRDVYLGFIGDLTFFDTQGSDDPLYSGLGARWLLLYLDAAEIAVAT
jgi:hypothetical protein